MKQKKSMELSMNTIIVAVIVLIVLVVIILIFTGQIGKTRLSLNRTSSTYSGEKCDMPGTARQCRTQDSCNNIGGTSYGRLDCMGLFVCCSE